MNEGLSWFVEYPLIKDGPVPSVVRYCTIILASIAAGLCANGFRCARTRDQRARFLALGWWCWAFVFSTLGHLGEPLTPRQPMYAVAVALTLYGLIPYVQKTSGSGRDT